MKQYENFQWMIQYLKTLDDLNAKILEGLGRYGPRNISLLAKTLKLPPTTVAFRVKKLLRNGFLRVHAIPNYSQLGLKHGFLVVESLPGYKEKLQKTILDVGYWTHVLRCYGKIDGLYATFAFPMEHEDKLLEYFKLVATLHKAPQCFFYWTTNPCYVDPDFSWFDFDKKTWSIKWQDWINEISNASTLLPEYLKESDAFAVNADKIDLLLLKELEKDGSAEFTKLAEVVKITPEGIGYRYHKHIIGKNLISDYQVAIFPYPTPISEACTFIIKFASQKNLAMFSNTLQNKPFVRSYFKAVGQDILIVNVYVLRNEFTTFLDALNSLIDKSLIESFFYVIHDLTSFKRQTISYEYFSDNRWKYDHESMLKSIR